jgi:penicillin-binding protein 2
MNPGLVFGEHIKTEKIQKRSYDESFRPRMKARSLLLLVVLLLGTGILLFRLIVLQLVHGTEYRALADSNRTRTKTIHAPRGVIFDRNGIPLVFNTPGFRQMIKTGDTVKTVPLSKEKALDLLAQGDHSIEVDSLREYPYKDATSHVLGYLGQITKEELSSEGFHNYAMTDWVGKDGIEKQYEQVLKGEDGKQLIEVDALGKEVRSLGKTDPVPGRDITLNLDIKLQQAAFDATKDVQKGAVVVSQPNGEILAMVSRPSFDANIFTLDEAYKPASTSAYKTVSAMLTDGQGQPLLNRAIGGTYPPGSTFKLLTAAAGLQNNIIDEHYSVTDTGVLQLGNFSYGNWFYIEQGKKESGQIDIVRALARSNDIFFYKLAEKVGVTVLAKTAQAFGIGQKLGIDLIGESKGLLPTKQWKKQVVKEEWFVGDTFHYGIGQGYLLTTPLQVNSWTAVFANGGTLYQPRLLKTQEAKIKTKELLSQKNQELVRKGMVESCEKGGVAYPLFNFTVKNKNLVVDGKNILPAASKSADFKEITIACKTGTAQHGGDETLPHAWITLFAPAYDPQIVVTVLVESKGQGSIEAAPIAKKILDAYFEEK